MKNNEFYVLDDFIDDSLEVLKNLRNKIAKIINYPPYQLDSSISKYENEDYKYTIDGSELIIYDDNGDEYIYNISSVGNKGDELYMGSTEKYDIIMCYDDDWWNTHIYILDKKNII